MRDPHTASFQSSCFSFRHCKTSNSLGIVHVTGDQTLPCSSVTSGRGAPPLLGQQLPQPRRVPGIWLSVDQS